MVIKQMSGEDIKNLRKKFLLSQREFSRKFKINLGTLRSWEQGWRPIEGTALVFFNILKQLTERNCSTQDFLYGLINTPIQK